MVMGGGGGQWTGNWRSPLPALISVARDGVGYLPCGVNNSVRIRGTVSWLWFTLGK